MNFIVFNKNLICVGPHNVYLADIATLFGTPF